MMKDLCPCHSGRKYADCCEPFHNGKAPESALELMRSRYAAYACNLPEYIVKTTHSDSPQASSDRAQWIKEISNFSLNTQFENLEIFDFQEKGDRATVTFKAHLTQNGRDASFSERSFFGKKGGRWLYLQGKANFS